MPGPMVVDTPSGVVARRMWPSRVDLLRVVDPRPPVQKILRSTVAFVCGGAQEPQSGFLDGVAERGRKGRTGGGWRLFSSKVVDIPVVTQRLIPLVQIVLTILEIPQLQYVDKVVCVPVVVVDAQKTVEASLLPCVDKVVDIPVVTQRLIPTVQTVQQTTEIPHFFFDKVIDVPVVQVVRVPQVPVVEKTVVLPQLQRVEKLVAFPDL